MVKKMSDLWREVMRCGKNEDGVTTMEYALVGSLVSIVAIAAMTNLGTAVVTAFTTITAAM